jgi:hypothetical protein
MSREPEKSLRQQIDDTVIDMRNELIMQGTNAFLFGRQCVLIGLGLTFMAADQLQAFAERAIERGETAQNDMQQRLGKAHHEVVDGATAAVSTRLSALLNKAPGVSVAYQPPAEQTPVEQTPPASSEPS